MSNYVSSVNKKYNISPGSDESCYIINLVIRFSDSLNRMMESYDEIEFETRISTQFIKYNDLQHDFAKFCQLI